VDDDEIDPLKLDGLELSLKGDGLSVVILFNLYHILLLTTIPITVESEVEHFGLALDDGIEILQFNSLE
jgi:hypothetical protein